MRLIFRPEARRELIEAQLWYESRASLHVVSDQYGDWTIVQSNCVVVSAAQYVDLSAEVRYNNAGSSAYIDVSQYGDAACTSSLGDSGPAGIVDPQGTWGDDQALDFSLAGPTHSVKVQLNAYGDVNFDHVLFGPTGTTNVANTDFIYSDGFDP